MRRRTFGLCFAGILALTTVSCPSAHAQAASAKTTVLALVVSAPDADPSLREVLQAIIHVQLARRKLATAAADTAEPQTPESIRALAERRGASYALVATYRTSGDQLELFFELRDAADGASLSSASLKGRIDLVIDDIVSQLLDRLLADRILRSEPAGSGPDRTEAARPSGSDPTTTPAGSAGEAGSRTEGTGGAGQTPGSAATLPVTAEAIVRPAGRWRFFGVSGGAAPLLMAGPAADFSKIGLLSTAEIAVRIPVGSGVLALGVLSGFGWLRAEGVVTSAEIALVPVGLDARYAPTAGTRADISLHLSGGAALMRVATPSGEPQMKIVPYGLAGMALDLPFTAFLGLMVEASFAAFLEASVPIVAFSPSLALRFRI